MLHISEEIGDFFDAPPNTLLIHACNCQGTWGAGIAKAFKDHYPVAFKEYKRHCDTHGRGLVTKAQLIAPVDHDVDNDIPKHFVGCLYTSRGKGRTVDPPDSILDASRPAMEGLLSQAAAWNEKADSDDDRIKEVRMCKINSGLFGVPWESTKAAIREIDGEKYGFTSVKVVSPA